MGMVTYDDKILSNAHVIAMEPGTAEFLDIGTPIIQPGSRDGGRLVNQVGELEAYIPIDFEPEAENYADAAICTIDPGVDASPGEQFFEEGNYWVEGWTNVSEGDIVRKSGRTTGVTTGEVIHTNASVLVWYGNQSASFVDQIVVTQENWSFIAPGDSGSAVDKDGEFVGLVFAGSETCAVISKAEHIIEGLGIASEPPEGQYSLTIPSIPGGSVTNPGEGLFIYDAETVVELVAEPGEHYRFVEWTGDVDTIANINADRTTITMHDSYSITANFESWRPEPWALLVVSSSEGGSVTNPGEGIFLCPLGTEVSLVAQASSGYQFTNWSGHVDAIEDVDASSTSIIMDNSYSVTANFEGAGSGCCVATASCGSPMAEEIQILREFRDEYLLTNPLGEVLVEFYYTVSPPMAAFVTEHPILKPIVRAGLMLAVAITSIVVNTSPT